MRFYFYQKINIALTEMKHSVNTFRNNSKDIYHGYAYYEFDFTGYNYCSVLFFSCFLCFESFS